MRFLLRPVIPISTIFRWVDLFAPSIVIGWVDFFAGFIVARLVRVSQLPYPISVVGFVGFRLFVVIEQAAKSEWSSQSGLKSCHRRYQHLLTFQCRCISRHPLTLQAQGHLRYSLLSSCKGSAPWKLEWLSIMHVTITVRGAIFHSRSLTRRAPHKFHG